MDKLTGALLKDKEAPHELRVRDDDMGFSRAEGAALREFHDLLRQLDKDRTRTWGGLQRVTTPAGDILWVCPQHYKEYDRGLPKVPTK